MVHTANVMHINCVLTQCYTLNALRVNCALTQWHTLWMCCILFVHWHNGTQLEYAAYYY